MSLYEYVGSMPKAFRDPKGSKRFIVMFDGFTTHPDEWINQAQDFRESKDYWIPWIEEEMGATMEYRDRQDQSVIFSESDGGGWNQHSIWPAMADIESRVLNNPIDCATGEPDPNGGCYHAIYIIGWSNGGDAAIELVKELKRRKICVFVGGITFDPVPRGL